MLIYTVMVSGSCHGSSVAGTVSVVSGTGGGKTSGESVSDRDSDSDICSVSPAAIVVSSPEVSSVFSEDTKTSGSVSVSSATSTDTSVFNVSVTVSDDS